MMRKFIGWFGEFLFAIIIIVVLFVMVASHNGWQFAAVLSGSMRPDFQVGGLVVIKPVDVNTLQVGDVISFKAPTISTNTPICHRIIAIQYQNGQEYFQTKGDANNTPDQNLTPVTNVNGKEIFYISYVGHLVDVKKIGSNRIDLFGNWIPLAAAVVTGMAILFIGLILKDTIESIFWPGKQWQKQANKKRKERLAARRKTFNL